MVNEEDTAFSSKKKTQTKRMGNLMQYLEELRSYAYTRGRYYANDYEKYKDKYENCKEFEEGFKDKIIKLFEEEETAKPYLDFIKWIEEKLDDKNGELGEEDKYCLYCESGSYDEKGIIHAPCCLITEIRKFLSVGSLDQHTKKKVHGVKE